MAGFSIQIGRLILVLRLARLARQKRLAAGSEEGR